MSNEYEALIKPADLLPVVERAIKDGKDLTVAVGLNAPAILVIETGGDHDYGVSVSVDLKRVVEGNEEETGC